MALPENYPEFPLGKDRQYRSVGSDPYRPLTIEAADESVDRLLNQISNALAHAHAEMERIVPNGPTADPNIKDMHVPTAVEDLTTILRSAQSLGERIDVAASRLGRVL